MLRRYRFALRPGWLVSHVLVIAAAVTMVLLGRWQLDVSESKHFSVQNFGYSLQWWLFAVFVGYFWYRILRDRARKGAGPDARQVAAAQLVQARERALEASAAGTTIETTVVPQPTSSASGTQSAEPVTYRRYVMPTMADRPVDAGDSLHAAYNEYLTRLASESEEQ